MYPSKHTIIKSTYTYIFQNYCLVFINRKMSNHCSYIEIKIFFLIISFIVTILETTRKQKENDSKNNQLNCFGILFYCFGSGVCRRYIYFN